MYVLQEKFSDLPQFKKISKICEYKRKIYIKRFLSLKNNLPLDVVRHIMDPLNPDNFCRGTIYSQNNYCVYDMCPSCFQVYKKHVSMLTKM